MRKHFAFWITLLFCLPLAAQPRTPGNIQIEAGTSELIGDKMILRGNDKAPARVRSQQIDVTAREIEFLLKENNIQQINARRNVMFKGDLAPKGGGEAARVEASSDEATYDPVTRTLTLKGNVNGWYKVSGKGQSNLSGSQAVLQYETNKNFKAQVGGAQGVTLTLPAENFTNNPAALGQVVITANSATYNSIDNTARFSGNAHAVSADGPNKFDISAGEFLLARGVSGTIETLSTVGRAQLKVDFPPTAEPVAVKTASTSTAKEATAAVGKPTHLEVAADAVTITRSNLSIVADGKVDGFYRLVSGATPRDYKFAGEHAVARYVLDKDATTSQPRGLNVLVTGDPVSLEAPGLTLE